MAAMGSIDEVGSCWDDAMSPTHAITSARAFQPARFRLPIVAPIRSSRIAKSIALGYYEPPALQMVASSIKKFTGALMIWGVLCALLLSRGALGHAFGGGRG